MTELLRWWILKMRYFEIFSPINTQNLKGSKMIESDLHTHIAMGVYNLCIAVANSIEKLTDNEVIEIEEFVYSLQIACQRSFSAITEHLDAEEIEKTGRLIELQSAIEDLKLFIDMRLPECIRSDEISIANNDLLVRLGNL